MNKKFNNKIINMIAFCQKKYNDKTFCHAVRVATYAVNNPLLEKYDNFDLINLYCYALAHDLIEDTDATYEEIAEIMDENLFFVKNTLELLTRDDNISYVDYIKKIKNAKDIIAYIVKLADIKDHLMLKNTLTDKLKAKYLNALPYLL